MEKSNQTQQTWKQNLNNLKKFQTFRFKQGEKLIMQQKSRSKQFPDIFADLNVEDDQNISQQSQQKIYQIEHDDDQLVLNDDQKKNIQMQIGDDGQPFYYMSAPSSYPLPYKNASQQDFGAFLYNQANIDVPNNIGGLPQYPWSAKTRFLETDMLSNEENAAIIKQKIASQSKEPKHQFAFSYNQNQMLKYDVETKRRGRRGPLDPDVEWDCMDKTLQNLIHFTCEQMVSDSFKKYCYPIVDQIQVAVESFLYGDQIHEICQNIHMCQYD